MTKITNNGRLPTSVDVSFDEPCTIQLRSTSTLQPGDRYYHPAPNHNNNYLEIIEQHGQPLKLEEIGSLLGITRERVRQLERGALAKLRKARVSKKYELDSFIDQIDSQPNYYSRSHNFEDIYN